MRSIRYQCVARLHRYTRVFAFLSVYRGISVVLITYQLLLLLLPQTVPFICVTHTRTYIIIIIIIMIMVHCRVRVLFAVNENDIFHCARVYDSLSTDSPPTVSCQRSTFWCFALLCENTRVVNILSQNT